MKLSIAMCTYNGARYVQQQLDSIATQARQPDELILCDDGSTDGTRQLLSSFALKSQFPVSLHFNRKRLGVIKNFEKAIQLCAGDVISLCDQDDVWRPEKLGHMEAVFLSSAGTGLVASDAVVVDEHEQSLGYRLWEHIISERKWHRIRNGETFNVLLSGDTVTGATMAFRSRFKGLILPIPTDIGFIHDSWIALMIAAVAEVAFIERPLLQYRRHSEQTSQISSPTKNESKILREKECTQGQWLNAYLAELRRVETVCDRLFRERAQFPCGEILKRLEDMVIHMNARMSMPDTKLSRGQLVLKELLAGRYHRYSNGLYSAAKDFALFRLSDRATPSQPRSH